jgi:sulfite reductase (NADPH) flavoprotein alpha-component
MFRAIHRWPGLIAALILIVLSLSGAVLSVFPAVESLASPKTVAEQSVADLTMRIQATHPLVEQIKRAPSGSITAYWFDNDAPASAVVDPATGRDVASADPNIMLLWLTDLHRSLFLGDNGRIVMALGAAAMLMLAISGSALVVRRTGGWRRWFAPLRGPLTGRLHVEIARLAIIGLALSSLTALWMTAGTFGFVSTETEPSPIPTDVSGQTGVAISAMETLKATKVADFRVLTFPYAGDATDVFTLKTDRGVGYIDQGTGALLTWADNSAWQQVYETIYMLHTGQGASVLGLVLGLMALGVPMMAVTGTLVWLAGRRGRPRIRHNVMAGHADTILLVGSENGSTWGFASTLHAALTKAGQRVHAAPMQRFAPERYTHAKRILVLAATYGDGDVPASAVGFIDRLRAMEALPAASLAVLGFGDRSFAHFNAFGQLVAEVAEDKGWPMLLPFDTVDRQSPQEFARWGRALGAAMGIDLALSHVPTLPVSVPLTLASRRDYGAEVQAPTAILRFALPRRGIWQRLTGRGFAGFRAGDLLGILPEGSAVPRFYSLASSHRDGFVEIVVRKHVGGVCSGQLADLQPGASVHAFLRRNPSFRPGRGHAPLILIGAGTGVGPLAGFVRENTRRRQIHLFFGMRHPDSDFLYREDLEGWQNDGHLAALNMAVSRGHRPYYVQDALRAEAGEIARLIIAGARVMVCGGREMAAGVTMALADVLAPVGLTPARLKAEGRYVEDVY